jgi:mannose-1-phosphate guanylyltransferase
VSSSSLYVLILAGGSGERFWPLSRRSRPKQLLSLFSKQTLLEDTLARLEGLVPRENILILTNQDQEKAVRELITDLPVENIVAEPAKRDTAAAIALGAAWISLRNSAATMIVLPADHLIKDHAAFQRTLRTAVTAAEQTGELVTIGIKPTWACPGFGYIEQGKPVALEHGDGDGQPVFEVIRFREKPNVELAEQFLKQGHFRWNAGMFIWSLASLVSVFERHAVELAEFVERVHVTKDLAKALAEKFPHLPKISVDYAIMEKAERVLMVEAGFDWDDVGGWLAVAKYFSRDSHGNISNESRLTTLDAGDNLLFSSQPKHVALMGVRDLIIVQTEDALLVCHRNDAEKIKHLVAQIPAELQ